MEIPLRVFPLSMKNFHVQVCLVHKIMEAAMRWLVTWVWLSNNIRKIKWVRLLRKESCFNSELVKGTEVKLSVNVRSLKCLCTRITSRRNGGCLYTSSIIMSWSYKTSSLSLAQMSILCSSPAVASRQLKKPQRWKLKIEQFREIFGWEH